MTDKGFKLSSGDKDFNNRVDDLFKSLDDVSTTLPSDGLVFDSSESNIKRSRDDNNITGQSIPSFSRNEEPFKRPTFNNIPRKKKFKGHHLPGYKSNPESWVKYDMRDTKVLDDLQNKEVALKLFSSMRNQKIEDNCSGTDDLEEKIVFKKPPPKKTSAADSSGSDMTPLPFDSIANRKFVENEYVVGTKKARKTKPKKNKEKDTKELKLSYLTFEDDEA